MSDSSQVPNRLARVRRKPQRGRYDRESVRAVLDAAPFCHVATVRDGRPVVLPMAYARVGDSVVLHGSPVAGLFRDVGAGSAVCVTATLFDGLVLDVSARHHSMNYRSVTVHGHAVRLTSEDEILTALRAIIDHLTPGRWDDVRPPDAKDLRETAVWRVDIEDASVKVRDEPPHDDPVPGVWTGQVPARLAFGAPVPLTPDADVPGYVTRLG
ncbi:pyridoxamine 5'-phosphate oxidase family protein [Nonomuraea roseoviolacea subsp. roseoviolacea]|uniref:Nitroimidazol reductase NimA-like FMN-containing flavoprotein (Pyridoxamine 5'-phosphate oxidase superfamily) n=1 Tax=Nonomuraea roseoviolacea subsp. carminata TaxID=160689 RepID=A0ABT1JVS8_9ACTN|nr:pyridoxamine 5'-phosphate oxidase family protein [Nonomuraea roseoviolacea]MCP2345685.1 nitroimidazol reductase NimA-like FMN-containing flavoprotein (pyridoxamine 5'-phosphate oxidase superfamily) [Nonomuraea roseoviolacea subsp. carminata]